MWKLNNRTTQPFHQPTYEIKVRPIQKWCPKLPKPFSIADIGGIYSKTEKLAHVKRPNNPVGHFPITKKIPVIFMSIITPVIMLILSRKSLLLGCGADRIRVKRDVSRGRYRRRAYKTVCASFTLAFIQVLLRPPVSSSSSTSPGSTACPWPRVPRSLLAAPRWATFTLMFPISRLLPAAFTRATSPGALLSNRSVWFGGTFRRVAPTAVPFVFWEPPERLRLTLKVCEREVRKDDCLLFINIGDKWDGGCAPWALPGARQRRLIYKVYHLVAAETPQFVLVALPATDHTWQVLEGVHTILRASPLAVWVMVMVALLVVGDQAAPAPLVARQGGAVVGTHYHVLGGAPSVKVWGDPVAGPHVGFVVGVSSCRGHLDATHRPNPSVYRSFWHSFT